MTDTLARDEPSPAPAGPGVVLVVHPSTVTFPQRAVRVCLVHVENLGGRAASACAAAALAAAVLAIAAGCSGSGMRRHPAVVPASSSSSITVSDAPGLPVVLRFDDHAVAATLADTPAARDFAANLPVSLVLRDAWGQAKTGPLPHPVQVEGATRVTTPVPGGIYYWPDTGTLAVYYDDLGQSVPPPGLIRLGAVDTGMDEDRRRRRPLHRPDRPAPQTST